MTTKRPAEAGREEAPARKPSQRTAPARQHVFSADESELRFELHDRLTAALAEIEHGDLHDVARTLLEGCLELLDKASPQPTRGWLL